MSTGSDGAPSMEAFGADQPYPDALTGTEETAAMAHISAATLDAARAVNQHHADRLAALRERAQSIDT
jgi:hypothetical protein